MGYSQTTAPTAEPVTLDEAKLWCRVDGNEEDAQILGLIIAARQWVEHQIGRQLVTATWTLKAKEFPSGGKPIYLPMPPLQSVTSVSYYDDDNASQTWSSSEYEVCTTDYIGYLQPKDGYEYPSTYQRFDAVTVVYQSGYGAASAVPQDVKLAIRQLVSEWYEHRDGMAFGLKEIPEGARRLLMNYWTWNLGPVDYA